MENNKLKNGISSHDNAINIQQEFVRYFTNREYMKLMTLLREKGNYFSKYKNSIDAVKDLQAYDLFDGLIDNSLTYTNDCIMKNGKIMSVWTFEFFKFTSGSTQNDENLLCSLDLINRSIVIKVENEKIVYLDWTNDYIPEQELINITKCN
jgi:hypothetical protein